MEAVVEPAREAFVGAMHLTAVGTAGCAVVAAVVVLVWLPGGACPPDVLPARPGVPPAGPRACPGPHAASTSGPPTPVR
ncbi:hypothetical protein A7K94_0219520 [Modestobacter sp. VKM Ac-2676]|nr:hypothetical protein A7K94_0219520 [Modestobacter sp. VKM Ac-2676]